jgi:type II secretory pathway pseudopilin PulG
MNQAKEILSLLRRLLQDLAARLRGPRLKLQPIPVRSRHSRGRRQDAFTMIELAISLAVIGFALVAIIGILPFAMNVQKENRQETIINQDASVFLNAIRNGERGIDDLTNYVVAITNFYQVMPNGPAQVAGYSFVGSDVVPAYPITNGLRIVGLLSTPRFDGIRSNYMVAYVRSVSGLASEKFPQNNRDVQDFAFSYRMLTEVLAPGWNYFHPEWTNFTAVTIENTNEWVWRSNNWILTRNTQTNYHDLRLTFRYPFIAGRTGDGRQIFRTAVSGQLTPTNEPGFTLLEHRLFLFEPRNYVQVKP